MRVIPNPVLGGFLAGTGWVLICGSFKVLTGLSSDATSFEQVLQDPLRLYLELTPGVAFGTALAYARRALPASRWVLPGFVAGGIAVWCVHMRHISANSMHAKASKHPFLNPVPQRLFECEQAGSKQAPLPLSCASTLALLVC